MPNTEIPSPEDKSTTKESVDSSHWKAIEEQVNEGMDFERQRRIASTDLFKETEIPKAVRDSYSEEEKAQLSQDPEALTIEIALSEEEKYGQMAKEILDPKDNPEAAALMALSWKNLAQAIRESTKIERGIEAKSEKEVALLADIEMHGISPSRQRALEIVRGQKESAVHQEEELRKSNPEAFYGLGLKDLRQYQKELSEGKMVEIPYVKEKSQDVVQHLRAGRPVFIHGHLGSGKTELAFHIARKYMGKDALVVSGSKDMSLAELYGHQVLKLDGVNKDELHEFTDVVEIRFNEWVAANPKATEEDKDRAHDRFLQSSLTELKSGTISDYFLGPVYKAMEDGRVVIIDEANAIPHEVLISLNHILTRRPGDKINVQQDSGKEITVAKGFGVVFTGNLNQLQEIYVDRQDMDPALLSRFYKVDYDYPQQNVEGSLEDEAGQENELYTLMVTMVLSKNGNVIAPKDSMQKLWRLAQAARVVQDVFSGKAVKEAYWKTEAGSRPVRPNLQEAVLSIRALSSIIDQWRKDAYEKELDHYIWKEFGSQSTVAGDRAYVYQLLKDRFGFFQSEGWPQEPSYGSEGVVTSFDINAPGNKPERVEFIGPRKVVEAVYGKPPKRAEWPNLDVEGLTSSETTSDIEKLKVIENAERTREQWRLEVQEMLAELVDQGKEIPPEGMELAKKLAINPESFGLKNG